jgi:hypothetical protein
MALGGNKSAKGGMMRRLFIWFAEVAGGAFFAALSGWFAVNFLATADPSLDVFIRLAVYIFSTTTGVYLVGGLLEQDGSFWFAFLGGALGATITWVIAEGQTAQDTSLIGLVRSFYSSLAIAGPLLATIGFNLGFKERIN